MYTSIGSRIKFVKSDRTTSGARSGVELRGQDPGVLEGFVEK